MTPKISDIIQITEDLMQDCKINIRDTWCGYYSSENLDDYYLNGNYNGPKSIRITVKNDGYADVHVNKMYKIPNYSSAAYDDYEIRIPKRLIGIKHPIIHETVHFLQEITGEEDQSYINYTGDNLEEYLSQRTELEAHYIQLKYIKENELGVINDDDTKDAFVKLMEQNPTYNENAIDVVRFSKINGII